MSGGKRVVVITGASRGLGLEWVRQLSQNPKNYVVAVVRNKEKATRLKPLLGASVAAVEADMSNLDTFPVAVREIEALSVDRVDVLINNAGIMVGAGAEIKEGISKSTVDEWDSQWRVNVVGPVFFTKALLPLLAKSSGKTVINISSFLGHTSFHEKTDGGVMYASYSATKAALDMANLKFHHEFRDQGFIFIALNPGCVNTELFDDEEVGEMAPLQADESVRRCLSFVDRVTAADSGKAFSLDGLREMVAS